MVDIIVRHADLRDTKDVGDWRNDPITRAQSRNSGAVPWAQHVAWFENALGNESRLILICEDVPTHSKIGMVRFDFAVGSGETIISINLAPEMRGKGFAKPCLHQSISYMFTRKPNCNTIWADIKKDNLGSKRSFEGAGFSLASQDDTYWRYRLDR